MPEPRDIQDDIPEELRGLVQSVEAPPGTEEMGEPEPAESILDKIGGRFMGTDIAEDPFEWTRLATEIGGSLGGALAGAAGGMAVGGPPGAVAGGVIGGLAGAGAGVATPEAVMEAGELVGLLPPNYREENGLNNRDMETVVEGALLLELATMGGLSGARAAGRWGVKTLTGMTKSSRELAETAARHNIALMPVQVGHRMLPRQFVAVMGRFPLLATSIRRGGLDSMKAMTRAFENLPARIAPSATMTGVSLKIFTDAKDLAARVSEDFSSQYEELFKRADDLGIKADPVKTITKARGVMAAIAKETPNVMKGKAKAPAAESMEELRSFIDAQFKGLTSQNAKGVTTFAAQSYKQMDGMLSAVDEKIASFAKRGMTAPIKFLEQVRQGIQYDMAMNVRHTGSGAITDIFGAMHTYAQQLTGQGVKGVALVREPAAKGTRELVYDLGKAPIPADSEQAVDAVTQMVEAIPDIDLDSYNSIFKVGDRMFSLAGGAGRDLVEVNAGQIAKELGPDKLMPLGKSRKSDAARSFAVEFRDLDRKFSHTISTLFETAAAKRFSSVQRRGVKGFNLDQSTRIPVDSLAEVLMRGDSPQVAEELSRIVTKDTFRELTSTVVSDSIEKATKAAGRLNIEGQEVITKNLDIPALRRALHVDTPGSKQYQKMSKMLEISGGLKMKEVKELLDVAEAISSVEIPNISAFIARRGIMGGLGSIIRGLIPGLSAAGGAGLAFGPPGLLGVATFIGGNKLVSRMLSDPLIARPLRNVLDKEATRYVKRSAYIKALRAGIWGMAEMGDVSMDAARNMQLLMESTVKELDRYNRENKDAR